MPFALRNGVRLYWILEGTSDKPAMVLLHSIGTGMSLWNGTVPHLMSTFRVLRLDIRGHGASDALEGDYNLAMLADDIVAIMDDAGIDRAAVAGLSLGGMIAMELALRHPSRTSALALICTSANMDRALWTERVELVRKGGTAAIVESAIARFFSARFAKAHPEAVETVRRSLIGMASSGYSGAAAAIRDMNLLERISSLHLPVLVISGRWDVSTPFEGHGGKIATAIAGSETADLDAGHLAPLEVPAQLATTLIRFLQRSPEIEAAADLLMDRGLANRRRILGDEWVDRSLALRTPFNADFQAMISRVAWQEIWGRPGLDDRTRRLLVVAMTASLGRWEEFALHVRAGLTRNGFSTEELKEVLMQIAIYAGLPAANTAFAEAAKIIASLEKA